MPTLPRAGEWTRDHVKSVGPEFPTQAMVPLYWIHEVLEEKEGIKRETSWIGGAMFIGVHGNGA